MAITNELLLILGFIAGIVIIGLVMIYLFFIASKDDRKRAPEQAATTAERAKTAVLGGVLVAVPIALVVLTLFIRTLF
ncbi:MAG: hypothetical protein ACFFBD_00530 [Candidatus Hodarchaeota archaeon]